MNDKHKLTCHMNSLAHMAEGKQFALTCKGCECGVSEPKYHEEGCHYGTDCGERDPKCRCICICKQLSVHQMNEGLRENNCTKCGEFHGIEPCSTPPVVEEKQKCPSCGKESSLSLAEAIRINAENGRCFECAISQNAAPVEKQCCKKCNHFSGSHWCACHGVSEYFPPTQGVEKHKEGCPRYWENNEVPRGWRGDEKCMCNDERFVPAPIEEKHEEAGVLKVSNFRCSVHGQINPRPVCPKCTPTAPSDLEAIFDEKWGGLYPLHNNRFPSAGGKRDDGT